MTPNEVDPVYSRPSYIPISGQTSPNGFPFYAAHAHNSPRNTPTLTRQYDSAQDAFNFNPVQENSVGMDQAENAYGPATTPRAIQGGQLGVPANVEG
jgi:hypothetical protein